jgi:hypothetical protein
MSPHLVLQIPVFIWAPEEEGQFQPGRYSRWWLKNTVILFAKAVEGLGSRLVIRRATETGKCLVQMVKVSTGCAQFLLLAAGLALIAAGPVRFVRLMPCLACLLVGNWSQGGVLQPPVRPHLTDEGPRGQRGEWHLRPRHSSMGNKDAVSGNQGI